MLSQIGVCRPLYLLTRPWLVDLGNVALSGLMKPKHFCKPISKFEKL